MRCDSNPDCCHVDFEGCNIVVGTIYLIIQFNDIVVSIEFEFDDVDTNRDKLVLE